jgi:hypothetical protein
MRALLSAISKRVLDPLTAVGRATLAGHEMSFLEHRLLGRPLAEGDQRETSEYRDRPTNFLPKGLSRSSLLGGGTGRDATARTRAANATRTTAAMRKLAYQGRPPGSAGVAAEV